MSGTGEQAEVGAEAEPSAFDSGGPPAHLLLEVEPDEGDASSAQPLDAYADAIAEAKDTGGPPADLMFEVDPVDVEPAPQPGDGHEVDDLDGGGFDDESTVSEPADQFAAAGGGNEGPDSGGPSPETNAIDVGAPPEELFQPLPGEDEEG